MTGSVRKSMGKQSISFPERKSYLNGHVWNWDGMGDSSMEKEKEGIKMCYQCVRRVV